MRVWWLVAVCAGFSAASCRAPESSPAPAAPTPPLPLYGEGVEVHVAFPYYQNRSAESIAEEIAANGYQNVLYVVCNDPSDIRPDVIGELHRRGLGVWGGFFATSVYSDPSIFPPGWEEWKMVSLLPDPTYRHLSFVHKGYREWMKARLVSGIERGGFDGVLLMEPFYPNWGGPGRQPTNYTDVSPAFQAAFREATGRDAFPNFTDPADPHYWKTDTALYRDLVDFRARSITEFYADIMNGPGGVREHYPDIVVASWSVGAALPNGPALLREWEGHDAEAMVRAVRPQVHYVQTHWPDWSRPDLPPDYTDAYRPYFAQAKAADPNVRIGFQADIGSLVPMRKSPEWYRAFREHAPAAGIDTTTYYEFMLRWEVYHQAPRLCRAYRGTGERDVVLVFDHRLDPASVASLAGRAATEFSSGRSFRIETAEGDGNLARLTTDAVLPAELTLAFPVAGVSDLPSVRFGETGPPNVIPPDARAWARIEERR